jgi:adenine-specific DNA-methyltransferase
MQDLHKNLEKILLSNERFVSEDGKILKNKITELAISGDKELLSSLLKDNKIKGHFFTEIDKGVLSFEREKFISFINTKEFLPNSFTSFKNKIGLTVGDEYVKSSKKVALAWAYKDCVLEGGQDKEDQKRSEVFYNEILAPDEIDRLLDKKVFTNVKKIDKNGEKKVEMFEDENLIIKGNNLLVLSSLLEKYRGKIKLIYIDPPYNTGSDSFGYNDRFNHSTWLTFMKNRLEIAKKLLKKDGTIFVQCDENEQAYLKVLMDGIFESKNFLNLVTIKAKSSAGASGGGEDRKLKKNYENILIYAMEGFESFNKVYQNDFLEDILSKKLKQKKNYEYNKVLINSGVEKEDTFINLGSGEKIKVFKHKSYQIKTVKELAKTEKISEYEVYKKYFSMIFRTQDAQSSIRHKVVDATEKEGGLYSINYTPSSGKNKNKEIQIFYYKNEMVNFLSNVAKVVNGEIIKYTIVGNLWTDIGWDGIGNEGGVKLKFGKKPEKLISRIIDMATEKGDLILDYHLGSGTTCAVAHKMNRKYIGIEQLNYEKNDSITRLKNVIKGDETGISKEANWKGGGSFVYAELKELNQEFINDIEKADSKSKLKNIYKKMQKEAFFRYEIDLSKFDEKDFDKLELEEQKQILIECLDKNHLYVNYSEIEDSTYKISPEDKKINKLFYEKN